MDKTTTRIIGGIYLAVLQGLSDEGQALANDILYKLADHAVSPEDAHVFRLIANAAVTNSPVEQQPEYRRTDLRVIDGGAA